MQEGYKKDVFEVAFDDAFEGALDSAMEGAPEGICEGEPESQVQDLYKNAKRRCIWVALEAVLVGVLYNAQERTK